MAGIIGAIDDEEGVVGVAPGARLWAVRVADDNGRARASWYLCGVDWVMSQRDPSDSSKPLIEVVNMSVSGLLQDGTTGTADRTSGTRCTRPSVPRWRTAPRMSLPQAINPPTPRHACRPRTTRSSPSPRWPTTTASRGHWPASRTSAPGTPPDADDTYGDFSNYGEDVDIIAPGKCILSTFLHGNWALMTGTSMATPTVTGAVALYISANPGVRPGQVRAALRNVASRDWKTSTLPDATTDLLLDVHAFDDPPTFAIDAGRRQPSAGSRRPVGGAPDHRASEWTHALRDAVRG